MPSALASSDPSDSDSATRCPHCRTVARCVPSATLHYVCAVCGTARIPHESSQNISTEEITALGAASAAHRAAFLWGSGAILGGLFGIAALGVVATIFVVVHPSVLGTLLALFIALLPSIFSLIAIFCRRQKQAQQRSALDEAWSLALRDVVDTHSSLTAREASGHLRFPAAPLERLLLHASARGWIRSEVTDEGDLRFTTTQASSRDQTRDRDAVLIRQLPNETESSVTNSDPLVARLPP